MTSNRNQMTAMKRVAVNQHKTDIREFGKTVSPAKKLIIMLHGRGAMAEDIAHALQGVLKIDDFAILAPQATNYTWYPYSFLAPPPQNEPWLTSALELIRFTTNIGTSNGVPHANIFFAGFSQGACLMLEYVTRNAERYGGVFAFSGGLIGDKIYPSNYKGEFGGTPVFLGCSDVDPHIPVQRVYATENLLKDRGANVTTRIYPGMGHTINEDEIAVVNSMITR
jgi:phospholipase/carboxylesterase